MFIQSKGFTKLLSIFIGANLYGGWLNVSLNVKQPIKKKGKKYGR
tara:strand:+ start:525 stop:659 length:135 start_codon:yes stop_codon:yes gene_type:complete